ncbi:MAG TPA: nuclear transport factor 2 family protein [Myxococcota bacterium]|nr:nuclear transport factor 2 family protein [Myxococcota bacterium]
MDPDAMTLETLLETEAIKRLKYKYMRCVDMKLWDEMAEVFLPDATAAYSAGHYSYEGRDAIIAWLRKGMDRDAFHSSHSVHHPEIELVSADRATGIWALEDVVIDLDYDIVISGAAFYHDRYVKREGRWWIEHTGYERVFEQLESRKDRPSLRLTASMWSTGGASSIKA